MQRVLSPLVVLTAGSAVILSNHPALAHGLASGGVTAGLSHPLLGLDHLAMLMAVGTAAALIAPQLLLWALGGAAIGAALGSSGFTVVAADVLAALAIAALGALVLVAGNPGKTSSADDLTTLSGAVVGGGLSIHAMLHGLEAPKDSSTLLWWSGALLSSALVCGGAYLLVKKLPVSAGKAVALALLAIGGWLALAPLGLLTGGAGA